MPKKPKLSQPSKELTTIEKRKLTSLEDIIDEHVGSFVKVGAALAEIRDKELYLRTALTFDQYVQNRWPQHLTTRHAYNLITSTKAAKAVEGLKIAPANGRGGSGKCSPRRKPHGGGVVGEDIKLSQAAALQLSKVASDAKKADVMQRAANFSKTRSGALNITKNAIQKAAVALGLAKPPKPRPKREPVAKTVTAELVAPKPKGKGASKTSAASLADNLHRKLLGQAARDLTEIAELNGGEGAQFKRANDGLNELMRSLLEMREGKQ